MASSDSKLASSVDSINKFLTDPLGDYLDETKDYQDNVMRKLEDILKAIQKGGGSGGGKSGGGKDKDDKGSFKDTANNIGTLAKGIAGIVAALSEFKKVKKDLSEFGDAINKLFSPENVKKWSSKEFTLATRNILLVGDAVAGVAKSLALATPLLLVGIPGVLLLLPMIYLLNVAFGLLSVTITPALLGMWALHVMGKAILRFSAAIAIAAVALLINPYALSVPLIFVGIILAFTGLANVVKVTGESGFLKLLSAVSMIGLSMVAMVAAILLTSFITMEMIGTYILVVGVIALTMMILGSKKINQPTRDAAINMAIIAGALVAFTLAAIICNAVEWSSIGKIALIIIMMVGVFWLLSKMKGDIAKGGASLLFIAGSVLVLAFAMKKIQQLDTSKLLTSFLVVAGLLLTMVGVAVLLGYGAGGIALGAGVLLLMAVAVLTWAYVQSMINEYNFDFEKNGRLMWYAVTTALKFSLIAPFTLPVAVASGVIFAMSHALLVWADVQNKIHDYSYDFEKAGRLTWYMVTTSLKFAAMGFPIVSGLALLGAGVGIAMGKALYKIASGIAKISEIKNLDDFIGEEGTDVKDTKVYRILNAVMKPFEEIGKEATGSVAGWIASKAFNCKTDVAIGIESVAGIGSALCDIAKGVAGFANLEFKDADGNVFKMKDDTFVKVANNIKEVVGSLTTVFIEIGNDIDSPWFSKSNIEKGKKAIDGVGNNICSIFDAVKKFAAPNIEYTYTDEKGKKKTGKLDIAKEGNAVQERIQGAIQSITHALATIGEDEEAQQGNWWIGYTKFDKGVKIVKTAADSVKDITGVINAVNTALEKVNGDTSKAQKNIEDVIGAITKYIVKQEGVVVDKEKVAKFKEFSTQVINIANNEPKLAKVAEHFQSVSNSLNSTFDKLKEVEVDKLKSAKEFFEKLIEYDKVESKIIDEKTSFVERALDKVNSVAYEFMHGEKPGASGDNKNPEGNNGEGTDTPKFDPKDINSVMAALTESMSQIQEKVASISNKLETGIVTVKKAGVVETIYDKYKNDI